VFDSNFTLSKRHLAMIAIVGGVLTLLGAIIYDQLGLSDPDAGFGPTQKLALLGAVGIIFLGATLIPLGKRPA
jgi:hypothetical protein